MNHVPPNAAGDDLPSVTDNWRTHLRARCLTLFRVKASRVRDRGHGNRKHDSGNRILSRCLEAASGSSLLYKVSDYIEELYSGLLS